MQKENTKEKLIDAAIVCLQEQGYESTSVASIVKLAKVAQGTFYIYFKTKYDMVLAIANRILSEQLSLCKKVNYKEKNFEGFLRVWIEIVFSIMKKHQSLIGYVTAKSTEKDRYIAWEALYEPYYQWLIQAISHYQKNNECIQENDTRALVILMIGTVEESAEQYYLFKSKPSHVEVAEDLVYRFLVRSLTQKKGVIA